MLTTLREFNISNATSVQKLYLSKIDRPGNIKHVNSCFDCQTFYGNLYFIYFYDNLGQYYNISQLYDTL